MKALKIFLVIPLLLLLASCTSDDGSNSFNYDGSTSEEEFNIVGFNSNNLTLEEGGTAVEVELTFKKPTQKEGAITILVSDLKNLEIRGADLNGDSKILLNFNANISTVSFFVIRLDDKIISENMDPWMLLEQITSPYFIKEGNKLLELEITDDELKGFPRKRENFYENEFVSKDTYFYNQSGQLSRIKTIWTDRLTLNTSSVIYEYNTEEKLIKISRHSHNYQWLTTYNWENDRIVSSESYGELHTYEYNSKGEIVSKISDYSLTIDKATGITEYTYNPEGNIIKSDETITHSTYMGEPIQNHNYQIITQYEGYNERINFFPEFEILPILNNQKNLPSTKLITGYVNNSLDFSLSLKYQYQYNLEGKVIRRSAEDGIIKYSYH